MKLVSKEEINKYNNEQYIWYACYGSNINYERFLYYIRGDKNEKYSTANGCKDKTLPRENRPYILESPIYFAGNSKKWGGGSAFLDYQQKGKSYGKIYKIKMGQFKELLEQEQKNKLYDVILLIDYIEGLPVFTFSAKHKLCDLLQEPSTEYKEVIKKGILEIYKNMDSRQIDEYLKNQKDKKKN